MKNNNAKAIYKLKKYFGVGSIHHSQNDMITYKLTDQSKFVKKLKPIFEQYPLKSCKYFDYCYLLKAIDVLNSPLSTNEKHNTLSQLKLEINELKRNRNLISPFCNLDFD